MNKICYGETALSHFIGIILFLSVYFKCQYSTNHGYQEALRWDSGITRVVTDLLSLYRTQRTPRGLILDSDNTQDSHVRLTFSHRHLVSTYMFLLPPTSEGLGKVKFSVACVCPPPRKEQARKDSTDPPPPFFLGPGNVGSIPLNQTFFLVYYI